MKHWTFSLVCFLLLTFAAAQESILVGSAPDDADVIRVWTPYTGPSLDWLVDELDTYSRAMGVGVEITSWTLGELRQLLVLAADDSAPADVLAGLPHDQIIELQEAGLLTDLRNFATAAYLADLPAGAALAFTFDEGLLGLPLTLEGPALLLNPDVQPQPPATYDDLLRASFAVDMTNFYFASAWLYTQDGAVFGRTAEGVLEPADVRLASNESLAGFSMLRDLRWSRTGLWRGSDYAAISEQFASGQLTYVYDGPWAVGNFFRAGIDVQAFPMPPLSDGRPWRGPVSVSGVLVHHHSPVRTAAANAAKWLVRADAQEALARGAGRIPASISAVDALTDDSLLHGFGLALRDGVAVPNTAAMSRLWQPLGELLEDMDVAPLSDEELADRLTGISRLIAE